jgi:hypothetical protein
MTTLTTRFAGNAGWRSTHLARSTGRPVSVYDGIAAGMDVAGGRWQTVCEDHGCIVSHQTIRLARWHAPCPDEWCGVCNGQDPTQDQVAK